MTSVTKGSKIPFFFTMVLHGTGVPGLQNVEPNSGTKKNGGSGLKVVKSSGSPVRNGRD
jgi:hypothetical protein